MHDLTQKPPEVHVWALWLEADDEVTGSYRETLSSAETIRAGSFALERLKRSYELAHGGLRLLLARYVNCLPNDLEFTHHPKGKPSLRNESRIHFSMSHSGGLAIYAVMAGREVGADVERVRPISNMERIAASFFCLDEFLDLESIGDTGSKRDAFFRCWTRKEAYIKALGDGLFHRLDQFQVTLLPDQPVQLVQIGRGSDVASEWILQHLEPAPGYVGALAYRGPALRVLSSRPLRPQELLECDPDFGFCLR
jgi:4'-phosphopantetheinyl transferase